MSASLLLWQGLLLNLFLSFSLVLLISVSGDLQFLPSKPGITGDQCACLDFSVGSEDFNSRLHTCATGTLPTEPSPWPLLKVFETNSGHLYFTYICYNGQFQMFDCFAKFRGFSLSNRFLVCFIFYYFDVEESFFS